MVAGSNPATAPTSERVQPMLAFASKRDRKTWLGLILRGEKTTEDLMNLFHCTESEVLEWLKREGVKVEFVVKPLSARSKEELIKEIYVLRSNLASNKTRLAIEQERADRYKRLYEEQIQ